MSQVESTRISRRQAIAATLGAAGIAAVGGTGASAGARPSRTGAVKGKRVLVATGEARYFNWMVPGATRSALISPVFKLYSISSVSWPLNRQGKRSLPTTFISCFAWS